MPYVEPVDALNQAVFDLADLVSKIGDGWSRLPLTASPLLRSVLLSWPAGYQSIPHRHPGAEELFIPLRGTIEMRDDDDRVQELRVGTLARAAPNMSHTFFVPGPGSAAMLAILAPNRDAIDETIEMTVREADANA